MLFRNSVAVAATPTALAVSCIICFATSILRHRAALPKKCDFAIGSKADVASAFARKADIAEQRRNVGSGPIPAVSRCSKILITCHRARAKVRFAERVLRSIGRGGAHHSGLMPALLITFAHFSASAARALPNSDGDLGVVIIPGSFKRFRTSGSFSASLIA